MNTVLATLFAATAAVSCSRLVLGNHPDFRIDPIGAPALAWLPVFVVFGLLTGALGAAYNGLVLWFLDHVGGFHRIPALAKAGAIGAVAGLVMFLSPLAVGGGDQLTQRILAGNHIVVTAVVGFLAVRLIAGPLWYSAAVPGGLFAPMLAVARKAIAVSGRLGSRATTRSPRPTPSRFSEPSSSARRWSGRRTSAAGPSARSSRRGAGSLTDFIMRLRW